MKSKIKELTEKCLDAALRRRLAPLAQAVVDDMTQKKIDSVFQARLAARQGAVTADDDDKWKASFRAQALEAGTLPVCTPEEFAEISALLASEAPRGARAKGDGDMISKARKQDLARSVAEASWKASFRAQALEAGTLPVCTPEECAELNALLAEEAGVSESESESE